MIKLARIRLLVLSLVFCFGVQPSLWAQDNIFDDGLGDTSSAAGGTGLDDLSGGLDGGATDPRAEYEAKLQAAEEMRSSGDYQSALTAFKELEQMSGSNPTMKDPRVLFGIAYCHQELGADDLAIGYYSQVLISRQATQVPGLLDAVYINRGKLYIKINRYREAVEDLTDARGANPQSAEAAMLLGAATIRSAITSPGGGRDSGGQQTIDAAITALTEAINIQPDYGEAYLERGRALNLKRNTEYAVADFESAVQYMGADSVAAAELASAYASRAGQQANRPNADRAKVVRDYRAALNAMDSYLASAQLGNKPAPWDKTDPFDQQVRPERVLLTRADTKIDLGNELEGQERTQLYESAIQDAQRILSIPDVQDEDLVQGHYVLGVGHRMMGDLSSASESLTTAIQIYAAAGRRFSEAYLRRGICYFHQGDYHKAKQDFDAAKVNELNPYSLDPRAMFWLGLTQAKMDDHAEAVRSYNRALSTAPRYTVALLNRGLAYLNMGRYDRAIEDFDTVLRQHPGHSEATNYRDLASRRNQ